MTEKECIFVQLKKSDMLNNISPEDLKHKIHCHEFLYLKYKGHLVNKDNFFSINVNSALFEIGL